MPEVSSSCGCSAACPLSLAPTITLLSVVLCSIPALPVRRLEEFGELALLEGQWLSWPGGSAVGDPAVWLASVTR